MSQINYHNVEIRQQENIVLEEVNLQIQEGEFVYLIGKVGSGKSSLLKTMYGELDIHSGQADVLSYDMARIRRAQIPALRKRIGIGRMHLHRKVLLCINKLDEHGKERECPTVASKLLFGQDLRKRSAVGEGGLPVGMQG